MMKHRIWGMVLAVCAACAMLVLGGCESYGPESTEVGAAAYYQDKYGEHAHVAESHGLGSYSLFGYSYHGMEYIMSDGSSVIYYDSEGEYRDNRQATDVQKAARAFAESKLGALPQAVVPPTIASVGVEPYDETYEGDGMCWHTRFDGDIEVFLRAERPMLSLEDQFSGEDYASGRFTYDMAFTEADAQAAEDVMLSLAPYFDIQAVEIAAVDAQAFVPGETSLFDDALRYTVSFKGESSGDVAALRFKPAFVPLVEGVTISSGTPGVTLAEGDVSLEGGAGGFYRCKVSGEAVRAAETMDYYIFNDSDNDIVEILGLDKFRTVSAAHVHAGWCSLADGAVYYVGDADDIAPRVDVESVSADKVVIRYHTFFKDRIQRVEFRTIGMGQRPGSSNYETMAFESRIIEETEDGWRCEIEIPPHAKPDNELALQFTYNGDKDVSVQIMQEVQL